MLPCPEGSQTCEQQDVAIQRMQDAGVDTVFLVAQTLAGSATVEKAQNLGYKPQWTTIGNNVTNTVAKFYANAKDNYDGAYGVDIAVQRLDPAAADCNQIAVGGRRRRVPASDSDGYGFTGGHLHPDAVDRQRDRGGRRHDRPGVGDRGDADARIRCHDRRAGRLVEQGQARRRNGGVPLAILGGHRDSSTPVDDEKPISVPA